MGLCSAQMRLVLVALMTIACSAEPVADESWCYAYDRGPWREVGAWEAPASTETVQVSVPWQVTLTDGVTVIVHHNDRDFTISSVSGYTDYAEGGEVRLDIEGAGRVRLLLCP